MNNDRVSLWEYSAEASWRYYTVVSVVNLTGAVAQDLNLCKLPSSCFASEALDRTNHSLEVAGVGSWATSAGYLQLVRTEYLMLALAAFVEMKPSTDVPGTGNNLQRATKKRPEEIHLSPAHRQQSIAITTESI